MKLSRQIGSANEPLWIFAQNATVSTGAGLADIVASSVSFTWCRSDQAAVSTGSCTTGTLGTYGVSSFVQAHSSFAIGFYQFSPPNGIYTSGSTVIMLLYGAPNMAPVPIEIELTKTNNQLYMSTQTVSTALNLITNADKAGYSGSMNVTSLAGSGPVTSSAGILSVTGSVSASTVTDKSGYGVSSVTSGVNVTSFVGSAAVTTAAGVLAYTFDLGRTANNDSTVAFSSLSISSQSVSVGGVNVTSIAGSAPVTTSAGVLATAFDLGRTLNATSTVAFTGVSINAVVSSVTLPVAEHAAISDKFLGRNLASGSDGGRMVKEALYVLRNKVDLSAGIVYEVDDATSSWAFTASTQAGNPIVSIDPA